MDDDLGRRMRERHEQGLRRQAERRAEVEEGRAPAEIMEAREVAFEVVGEELNDDACDYITTLVYDEYDTAQRHRDQFDPQKSGQKVGRRIAEVRDWQKKGGIGGWVQQMRQPYALTLYDRVRLGLESTRPDPPPTLRIEREPMEVVASPFGAWREESAERENRQIDALQRLVDLQEAQSEANRSTSKLMLALTVIATVAAVVAAVAAIIALL